MGGTPTPPTTLDSGNAADATYLGNFELYSTASTGSSTWSPGSFTMPSGGLLVAIYTGRDANISPVGVDITSIDLGGTAATLYRLNDHAQDIDKMRVACRQVSAGSNAIDVHYAGTLTGSGTDIAQVVSGWYISGHTSDIPRTADNTATGVPPLSVTYTKFGNSVTIFQYWVYQGTAHAFTGDTLTTDVNWNAIGARTTGAWGAQHIRNSSADLASVTTGMSWTTNCAADIVCVNFK